ncbi:MAG: hypothetical protein D6710_05115 [Nitrospirae bacterium]|nr:MAG: hypothetical protein D6710_05115 [Nitrospirota bacterium]
MVSDSRKTTIGNRGAVLVTVLLVVSALLTLTVMQNERASADYEAVSRVKGRLQGYVYCSTALKALVEILKEDDNLYDGPDESWAQLPTIPTEEGFLSIKIVPLNSRIPLLKINDEAFSERVEDALLNINPDMDVEAIREHLRSVKPYSATELFLRREAFNLKASDMAFINTEETDGRININFAPEEIIRAYLPELEPFIEEIVKYREEHPFKDISEIRKIPGIDDQLYLSVQGLITVKSPLLIVHVISEVADEAVDVISVFQKGSKSARILKYFEGARFFYEKP